MMQRNTGSTSDWQWLPLLMLGGALGLTLWLYWPGLTGPFLLDDQHNIAPLMLGNYSPSAIWYALTHNESGLFGRMLSTASLLLTGWLHGPGSWGFKYHNLLIHLLTGLLLVGCCGRLLCWRLAQRDAWRLAVLAGLFWLLHPLQVSTVLYPVQRMAQLGVLFTVAGLYVALLGLEQARDGRRGRAIGLLFFGYPLLLAMAVASKESGVLLLPLTLLALGFIWPTLRPQQGLVGLQRNFALLLVLLPLLLGLLYFALRWPRLLDYSGRLFTLPERIYTQLHVLWFYLKLILLPRLGEMGLYHDDFATVSQPSLLTAVAGAGLVALLAVAWLARRRWPVVSLGIGWFFVGHLLESTVLPLEMVFEHRNYLAAFGPLLLVAYGILAFSPSMRLFKWGVVVTLLCSFALMTSARAKVWSDDGLLQEMSVQEHPDSARARSYYANYLFEHGELAKGREQLEYIRTRLLPDPGVTLHLLGSHCNEAQMPEPLLAEAAQRLIDYPVNPYALNGLNMLAQRLIYGKCSALDADRLWQMIAGSLASEQSRSSRSYLHRLQAQVAVARGDLAAAYEQLDLAYQAGGGTAVLIEKADLALGASDTATAEVALKTAMTTQGRLAPDHYKIARLQQILEHQQQQQAEQAASKG